MITKIFKVEKYFSNKEIGKKYIKCFNSNLYYFSNYVFFMKAANNTKMKSAHRIHTFNNLL